MCLCRRNGCSLPEGQQPAAERCSDVSADQAAARRGGPGAARAQLPAAPVPPAQRAQRGRGGPAALLRERQHAVRGCTAPGSMAARGTLTEPSCGHALLQSLEVQASCFAETCHTHPQLCKTRSGCLPGRAGSCLLVFDLAGCARGKPCRAVLPSAQICCILAHIPQHGLSSCCEQRETLLRLLDHAGC